MPPFEMPIPTSTAQRYNASPRAQIVTCPFPNTIFLFYLAGRHLHPLFAIPPEESCDSEWSSSSYGFLQPANGLFAQSLKAYTPPRFSPVFKVSTLLDPQGLPEQFWSAARLLRASELRCDRNAPASSQPDASRRPSSTTDGRYRKSTRPTSRMPCGHGAANHDHADDVTCVWQRLYEAKNYRPH